jgi:hypothetical protein
MSYTALAEPEARSPASSTKDTVAAGLGARRIASWTRCLIVKIMNANLATISYWIKSAALGGLRADKLIVCLITLIVN